jgi:hypothetical protein
MKSSDLVDPNSEILNLCLVKITSAFSFSGFHPVNRLGITRVLAVKNARCAATLPSKGNRGATSSQNNGLTHSLRVTLS